MLVKYYVSTTKCKAWKHLKSIYYLPLAQGVQKASYLGFQRAAGGGCRSRRRCSLEAASERAGGRRRLLPTAGERGGGAGQESTRGGEREREQAVVGMLCDSVRSRPVDCDISFGSPVEAEAQQDRPMSQ